jgi:hypothetical protein
MTLTLIPDITTWTRLEPQPRKNDFVGTLRAELRDPMWLLNRQRRVGEFKGEDTGSPAYARITRQAAPITKWGYRTGLFLDGTPTEITLDPARPIEAQALSEPHVADVATQVELGQVFFDLLDTKIGTETTRNKIKGRFRDATVAPFAQLKLDDPTPFNPRDRQSRQFLLVAQAGAVNGFGIYLKAKDVLAPGGTFPPGLADDATEQAAITEAFDRLIKWLEQTYGSMSYGTDAPGWDPRRLEFDLRLRAGDGGQALLTAVPDRDGALTWPSFDLAEQSADPFTDPNGTETTNEVPRHIRFHGMPAPRYWDFESGGLSVADVNVGITELAKLVMIDFAVVYGIDWFTVPLDIDAGNIVRVQSLVVRDVFGRDTTVNRADDPTLPAGPGRWSIFTPSQPGAGLATFGVVPSGTSRTVQAGPVLEEVRFARDEQANFVWGIERVTLSPIGQPRPGNERDAAVDAASPPPPASTDTTSPLHYQIESKVPVNWIPFLPVKLIPSNPKIELEKAAVARPNPDAVTDPTKHVLLVPSIAKLLDPDKIDKATQQVYRLPEEEVPRSGLRVQRLVHRSRWVDGSAHVWLTRRKLVGAGETQSGLRFDAALPTPK